ncbi:MAG: KpsF/GutQ family sugar-phosphate isomerase [Candidatus Adiutrix sp.]|jgi:arabinose-5-phosphate isomerase|nr:KpsF/GutQ family sugar-phosphate isomerase [Candidatus Adiutrix sp.]
MDSRKDQDQILAEAVRVLNNEARSLKVLAESLNGDFTDAVDLLLKLEGRVAVCGMGKSGHVARKVAATLASTGAPAYFIHPAEASHGDLGMLAPRDALLAFSNSGETLELESILIFCARRQIPVIGVTKNPASLLGRQSRLVLELPDLPEACPFGSAPTTSTTMMMALGDALALCLLEAKGFTPEDFHQYHPGGSLGRKLLAVRDIMHVGDEIPILHPDQPMPEVLYTITGKSLGCSGVLGPDGTLIGIVTDGDLRRHMAADFLKLSARQIMTANPVTVGPDTLAAQVLGLMQKKSITSVFVVDEQLRPLGLVHIHDCLRAGLE